MKLSNLINNSVPSEKFYVGFLEQSGYLIKTEKTTVLIDPYLSDYNGEKPDHFINYLNQFSPNQKVRILNHSEIITV